MTLLDQEHEEKIQDTTAKANDLISQCEQLVQAAGTAMITVPVPQPLLQFQAVSNIRKWRTRRRDAHIIALYEKVYPKIKETEKLLRQVR